MKTTDRKLKIGVNRNSHIFIYKIISSNDSYEF